MGRYEIFLQRILTLTSHVFQAHQAMDPVYTEDLVTEMSGVMMMPVQKSEDLEGDIVAAFND